MRTNTRILLSVVLAAFCLVSLHAQEIEVPKSIQWEDPPLWPQFKVNQHLQLKFIANGIGKEKLGARLFRGHIEDLLKQAHTASSQTCLDFPSYFFSYDKPAGGGYVWFQGDFVLDFLQPRDDGGYKDEVWTVVLEEQNAVSRFRPFPKDKNIEAYFRSGHEIVVLCTEHCEAGFRAWLQNKFEGDKAAGRTTVSAAQAPAAPPPVTAAKLDCIHIRTVPVSKAASEEPVSVVAQLIPEPCTAVGQPFPLHLPFVNIAGTLALR